MDDDIKQELEKYYIYDSNILNLSVLSDKDNILVIKFTHEGKNYVFKYFKDDFQKREVENYNLLKKLGITTVKIYGMHSNSILMEDLTSNENTRLAAISDLKDEPIVRSLAKWYLKLHTSGKEYVNNNEIKTMYCELDSLSYQRIEYIREKSNYDDEEFWELFYKNFNNIKKMYMDKVTITYNDFFYGNMGIVNNNDVIMFDFNLMGIGLAYFDIKNVTYGFSDILYDIFMEEYGSYDKEEELLYDVLSPIISLDVAYRKNEFPKWGVDSLEELTSGKTKEKLKELIKNI